MGDKKEMDKYEELVNRIDSLNVRVDEINQARLVDMTQVLTDRYAGKLVQVEQEGRFYVSYLVKSPKFHVLQGTVSLQPSNYDAEKGEGVPVRVPDMTPLYSPIPVRVSDILVVKQDNLEEHLEYALQKKAEADATFQGALAYIEAYVENKELSTEWADSQEDSEEDSERAEKGFQEALPAIEDPSQTPVVVNNIIKYNLEEILLAKDILKVVEKPIDGETDKESE